MANHAEEPLQKVTINLFARQVAALERRYGRGWSDRVRLAVDRFLKDTQPKDQPDAT